MRRWAFLEMLIAGGWEVASFGGGNSGNGPQQFRIDLAREPNSKIVRVPTESGEKP